MTKRQTSRAQPSLVFRDTPEAFRILIDRADVPGVWMDVQNDGHAFHPEIGGAITFWANTKNIQFQGPAEAMRRKVKRLISEHRTADQPTYPCDLIFGVSVLNATDEDAIKRVLSRLGIRAFRVALGWVKEVKG